MAKQRWKGSGMRWPAMLAAMALMARSGFAAPGAAPINQIGPDGEETQSDAAQDSNKYLGNVYKDEAAGFKMAPPAGSTLSHGPGLPLLTFVQKQKQWGGEVQLVNLKDKTTVKDYMAARVGELGKDFKGVQVLENRELTFDKHQAGRLATSMEADVTPPGGARGAAARQILTLYRQQLIVQMADDQFMVLTFYTAMKDRKDATATFNAMVGAFEILDITALDRKRLDAIKLAKTWLAKRSAEELKEKLIAQPQLFRMKVAGKDVGYMRFDEHPANQDGRDGVEVDSASRGWLVDETTPGLSLQERTKILLSKNIAFWANSRDERTHEERPGYSTWDNSTATIATGKQYPGGKYEFWVREAGILNDQWNTRLDPGTLEMLRKEREDMLKRKDLMGYQIPPPIDGPQKQSHLIVNFTGDPTQAFTEAGKGVDVMIPEYRQAVLPKILEYVWPRLVDLSKPSEMVFAVYNSSTRKMALRTLDVVGPGHVMVDGKMTDCVKCTDEMDNSGTTLWVDSTGRILKMLTSDQSLLEPTTEEEMQRLWGDKLKG